MQMTRHDLTPREAMERWLGEQRIDKSEETVSTYYYRLRLFVDWCEERDIETVDELDGWLLNEYAAHRQQIANATSTMKNELVTLRNWLQYCERIEILADGTAEKVDVPTVPVHEQSSNIKLDTDAALALLEYYRSTPGVYGSRGHALLELLWHTGARVGGIQALDLDDRHETDGGRHYLMFRNRPEADTRLKKGDAGERPVLVSGPVRDVLDSYIEQYRDDVTDDYGREPLITSQLGRPAKSSLRDWTYEATIPCHHSDCPHGKQRDTCEWTSYGTASQCPSSRSPHQIRTGAITWMRNRGLPADVVAERVNAKVSTIERHYDKADPVTEMLERRGRATSDLDIGNTEDTT